MVFLNSCSKAMIGFGVVHKIDSEVIRKQYCIFDQFYSNVFVSGFSR